MDVKKFLAGVLACSVVWGTLTPTAPQKLVSSITANAETDDDGNEYTEGTEGMLTYEKYSDHIEILHCDKRVQGEFIIPDTIEGFPVTSIKRSAFEGCSSLTSLTIPEGVKSIGAWVVFDCESLKSINIENPDCEIYDASYTLCNALDDYGQEYFNSTLYGHEGSTAQAFAEKYNYNFKTFTEKENEFTYEMQGEFEYRIYKDHAEISGGDGDFYAQYIIEIPSEIYGLPVTKITAKIFRNLPKAEKIVLPEHLEEIKESCFENCGNLETIVIPSSVKSIGNRAFYECNNLKSITVPESVASIGDNAFGDCDKLYSLLIENPDCLIFDSDSTISYGEEDPNHLLHIIYGKEGSTAQAFAEKYGYNFELLENAPLKMNFLYDEYDDNIRIIGYINKPDGELVLPDTIAGNDITSVAGYAFYRCSSIKSLKLPKNLEIIGEETFRECNSLEMVVIPPNVTLLQSSAFGYCPNLKTVIIESPNCRLGYEYPPIYGGWKDGYFYDGTIYGYEGSTAQKYAENFGFKFDLIENAPTTDSPDKEITYGDANNDGEISIDDAVLIMQALANPDKYGVGGSDPNAMTEQGKLNADCFEPGSDLTAKDALSVQRFLLGSVTELPET